jgi:hypothetical protein
MNTPKKHHFVPQMLLRRFCDRDGKLWYFTKRAPKDGILYGSPQSLFYETHLYTVRETDGGKDSSLELYFSQLEGAANSVIDKVCAAARGGRNPGLTRDEKRIWDLFLYFQWKRTPDAISAAMSDDEFRVMLSESVTRFETTFRSLNDKEKKLLQSEVGRKQIRHNAWVKAVGDPGPLVQKALGRMGLAVAVIRKPNKSFIIGSRPSVKLTPPGETRLGQPDVELWLPVAADVAIGAFSEGGTEAVINLTDDAWLRQFNLAVFQNSTSIAGRSERLIKSITGAR